MGAIGEYIISVTSAALVCGCLRSIFDEKSTVSTVLKLLCGIFLSLVALQPLMEIDLKDLPSINYFETGRGNEIIEDAQLAASNQQREFISEKCQTYIAQKAQELSCSLEIRVSTDETAPYAPSGVEITGSISPYARGQLTNWISDNLAIKAEDQIWIG